MPKQDAPRDDHGDPRTALAEDRTVFAAERSYAAWVRTGLAALAAGIGGNKLLGGNEAGLGVKLAGTILILFSLFCFAAAVWRELFPGLTALKPDVPRIPGWVLYMVNALLALAALLASVSIWAR